MDDLPPGVVVDEGHVWSVSVQNTVFSAKSGVAVKPTHLVWAAGAWCNVERKATTDTQLVVPKARTMTQGLGHINCVGGESPEAAALAITITCVYLHYAGLHQALPQDVRVITVNVSCKPCEGWSPTLDMRQFEMMLRRHGRIHHHSNPVSYVVFAYSTGAGPDGTGGNAVTFTIHDKLKFSIAGCTPANYLEIAKHGIRIVTAAVAQQEERARAAAQ